MKKIFSLLVIFSLLILLSGCKWNSKATIRKVEKKLEEKYNEPFSTSAIGDRYNTDYTRLYCYPDKNKELLFNVYYYDDGRMVDYYAEARIEYDLAQELSNEIKKYNIDSVSKVVIGAEGRDESKNYLNMTAKEYLVDVKAIHLYIEMSINSDTIKSESDVENLKKAIKDFSDRYNSIEVVNAVYLIRGEQYNEVVKFYKKHTSIDDSIDDYTDGEKRHVTILVNQEKGKVTVNKSIMDIINSD